MQHRGVRPCEASGTMLNPIALILFFPLIAAVVLWLVKSKTLNSLVLVADACLYLAVSIIITIWPCEFTPYFRSDSLNVVFMLVLGVVYLGVALYNLFSMRTTDAPVAWHTNYTIAFLLFVFSMTGVALSTHAALLWVFVEATTLMSAPLILFSRTKSSLEAAWKYIFICSIGIAIAFVGIILLSIGIGPERSLFFADLATSSKQIAPVWLKLAFPFILIGLGTKVGLAPVHAWLPDAHSEAPAAVSAMLSGALLNMAFLGIMRFHTLMISAGYGGYAQTMLLIMGFLSMFVSAVFIIRVTNYKRMLAYSSIENMGIVAIGLGIGGPGIFAALLHVVAHSLSKASFFLTSGNILRTYKSREIKGVRGIIGRDTITGWLWVACFAALAGMPPFPIFLSEFLLVRAMFAEGAYPLAVVFFLLVLIIVYGMGNTVVRMTFGTGEPSARAQRPAVLTWVPQLVFLVILVMLGIGLGSFNFDLIEKAASFF